MKILFTKNLFLLSLILLSIQQIKTQGQFLKCSQQDQQQLCKQQNKKPVCALDDDNQYLTFVSACQACSFQDTLTYTMGPCQCPNIPCPQGQECLGGECRKLQGLNNQEIQQIAHQFILKQKYQSALKLLQNILTSTDSENDYTLYLAALASYGSQKNKQSLRYIKKAISINPNISGYYVIRGRAFIQTKQFQEAQKQFKKALELGFQDLGLISFYQAQNLLKNQKNEAAIKKFEEALKYHPQKTQWYIRKAMAHAINKQYKMALLTCRQGLKIEPKNKQILLFMKQFQNIDSGHEDELEKIREDNQKQENSTQPRRDPQQYMNKVIEQKLEQKHYDFDLNRIRQKNKQKEKEGQKDQQNAEKQEL